MTYYKVTKSSEFIGVGTSDDLRKYQTAHGILLIASPPQAECIEIEGKLYYDPSVFLTINPVLVYENATITEISKEEFHSLETAVEANEAIFVETDPIAEEAEETDTNDVLDNTIQLKLSELGKSCQKRIYEGIDFAGDDGIVQHYSLSFADQINIERLFTASLADVTELPYHADGEAIRNYSKWEIKSLKNEKDKFIDECTLKYNQLKLQVLAMADLDQINEVHY